MLRKPEPTRTQLYIYIVLNVRNDLKLRFDALAKIFVILLL